MEKQLVILAKSRKNKGYCVAGITIGEDGGEYIRLGEGNMCAELGEDRLTLGGRSIQILDKVTVEVERLPPAPPQTENYKLRSILSIDGKITQDEFNMILSKISEEPFIFMSTAPMLVGKEPPPTKGSLQFAKVTDVRIHGSHYIYRDQDKYRYKCHFRYNGNEYKDVSITDPIVENIIKNEIKNKMKSDKVGTLDCYLCDEMYVMFSLPHPDSKFVREHSEYYKYAAGMIPPMF